MQLKKSWKILCNGTNHHGHLYGIVGHTLSTQLDQVRHVVFGYVIDGEDAGVVYAVAVARSKDADL